MSGALVDTSVFIAEETSRPIEIHRLPEQLAVSVITIGELRAGVLASHEPVIAARRLRTLERARLLDPLLISDEVAEAWAELRVWLRDHDRTMGVNDSWIAATAIAHGLAVATQDAGYDDVMGLHVVHL